MQVSASRSAACSSAGSAPASHAQQPRVFSESTIACAATGGGTTPSATCISRGGLAARAASSASAAAAHISELALPSRGVRLGAEMACNHKSNIFAISPANQVVMKIACVVPKRSSPSMNY